jgi:hypothetical protein
MSYTDDAFSPTATTTQCERQRPLPQHSGDGSDRADDPFEWLPDELVLAILLATAEAKALGSWSVLSRRHHTLAMEPSVWRHLCVTHLGRTIYEPPLPPHVDWRWMYRAQRHVASPAGADIGALFIDDGTRIYWGDTVDGRPHGFGMAADANGPYADGESPQRLRIDLAHQNDTTACARAHRATGSKASLTARESLKPSRTDRALKETTAMASGAPMAYEPTRGPGATRVHSTAYCLMATVLLCSLMAADTREPFNTLDVTARVSAPPRAVTLSLAVGWTIG